jgi:hypothetical protein
MSSHPVGRSAATQAKDRASLCLFTFTDGRRCRTPRTTGHPHFCFYHARKESQARVAEKLGNDLNFFLSGEYLSANDLAVALGRIIPAVVRGDLKPRTATTVAYLAQTLLQTIHLAQDEYLNAFSNRVWGETIRNAVRQNWKYRHPAPAPAQPATADVEAGLQPGPVSNHTAPPEPNSSNEEPSPDPAPPQPNEPASPSGQDVSNEQDTVAASNQQDDPNKAVQVDEEDQATEQDEVDDEEVNEEDDDLARVPTLRAADSHPSSTSDQPKRPHP